MRGPIAESNRRRGAFGRDSRGCGAVAHCLSPFARLCPAPPAGVVGEPAFV